MEVASEDSMQHSVKAGDDDEEEAESLSTLVGDRRKSKLSLSRRKSEAARLVGQPSQDQAQAKGMYLF